MLTVKGYEKNNVKYHYDTTLAFKINKKKIISTSQRRKKKKRKDITQ